eukprot:CAMPEP_0204618022 /NCGR_PEP_ID=MMETSP0717-20131115/4813_1 /ASSEMBLY_ACC=CAM_ASM_000666 /TAXON_ID=230516 /ORGANISM="Chaetoceros curvisetus" /LENGTH=33 /DNA_ID= /DNA_START= /DNA_END= /DNA_ORIENTATION=
MVLVLLKDAEDAREVSSCLSLAWAMEVIEDADT